MTNITHSSFTWLTACALLILTMQVGYLCVETGLFYRKGRLSIILKRFSHLIVTAFVFLIVGFGLMFGTLNLGPVQATDFLLELGSRAGGAFFLFQLMLASTVVLIVASALIGRIHAYTHLLITVFITGLIFPLFGSWLWGNPITNVPAGWMSQIGVVDFAGGAAVHSLAGWITLAILIIIKSGGQSNPKQAVSLPIAFIGLPLILAGSVGIIGGSLSDPSTQLVLAVGNSIAAAFGGVVTILIHPKVFHSKSLYRFVIKGGIAGIVSISAVAVAAGPIAAFVIGMIGSLLMILATQLLDSLRIYDPVGIVPVHLAAGMWSMLAVAIFGDPAVLSTELSTGDQLTTQFFGIGINAIWAFVPTFFIFYFINQNNPLFKIRLFKKRAFNKVRNFGRSRKSGTPGDTLIQFHPADVDLITHQYNGVVGRLQDKNSQLTTVLNNSPVALFSTNIYGVVTLLEGQMFKNLGIGLEQSIYSYFDNDDPARQHVLSVYEGESRDWVTQIKNRHISFQCQPIKNRRGEVRGLTGVALDVTAEKLADIERERQADMLSISAKISDQITTILDTEELLETILLLLKHNFNLYHAAVLMLDEDTRTLRFEYGSDRRAQSLMAAREFIEIDHPHSIIARACRTRQVVIVNDSSAEPNYMHHPLFKETRSELAIPLMVHNQMIGVLDIQEKTVNRFSPSDVNLFSSISRQIAIAIQNANLFEEAKRSEAQMQVAMNRAVDSDKAKDEFLARVSHELRTPLGVILGYAEMLQDEIYGPISAEQYERLDNIVQSSENLTSLVNQLLDSAKLDSGKIEPTYKAVDLPPLIRSIAKQMQVLAEQKGLAFHVEMGADLPKNIVCDPALISQMLINLIGNAIKYTDSGFVRLEVIAPDEDHFALMVKDSGIGIPAEYQSLIFMPFHQVDGTKTRTYRGTGLGLAITKRMADVLNGVIKLVSIEGRGSQFTVILPVSPRKSKPKTARLPEPSPDIQLPKHTLPEFEQGSELEPIPLPIFKERLSWSPKRRDH